MGKLTDLFNGFKVAVAGPKFPNIESADELKALVLKSIDHYRGQVISDRTKYRVLHEVNRVLLHAYERGLLKQEPDDLRAGSYACIIVLFHGPFYLEDWIDRVWRDPECPPPTLKGKVVV
jgi:hypothetical protein